MSRHRTLSFRRALQVIVLLYTLFISRSSSAWKPLVLNSPPLEFNSPRVSYNEFEEKCSLYKVSFAQDLYFQYIQYKVRMPDMIQFTLCAWKKFHNHTNDHPIFSYAVKHQPRAIYSWISNTPRSSYYSMSVEGHTLYRLNYPLRLNRWYHSCQSWNGRTGEWQVWVNAERIGRGYHNRLVKHIIPGGGIAITGQQQRQYGGGFLEGHGAPPGSGGYLGEITLLQLYSAPLAPGKAHKDHKHHHGNHNHHHHPTTVNTNPPLPQVQPLLSANPFINSGQLVRDLDIQSQLGRTQLGPNGVLLNAGLPQPNLVSISTYSIPLGLAPIDVANTYLHNIYKRNEKDSYTEGTDKKDHDITITKDTLKAWTDDKGDEHIVVKRNGNDTKSLKITANRRSMDFNERSTTDLNKRSTGPSERSSADLNRKSTDLSERSSSDLNKRSTDPSERSSANINKGSTDLSERFSADLNKRSTDHNIKLLEKNEIVLKGTPAIHGTNNENKQQTKRDILLGSPLPSLSGLLSTEDVGPSFIGTELKFPTFNLDFESENNDDKDKDYPREPAEAEVLQIMNTCSGCSIEPFKKVEVISWRHTPKKLYSGALFIPARQECKRF